jgi:ketosteroid isomerase-like protein
MFVATILKEHLTVAPQLPGVLDQYYAAQNAHDIDAMVACFTPDATVHDEGRTIVGSDAIRAWKEETSAKYHVTAEPLESRTEGGQTIVVTKVTGTFDGSPAILTYRFGLAADGRIGALEVQ